MQFQVSHVWWEFQAETLYMYPKPFFGHMYKVQYTNFERIFLTAHEMLVKLSPGH